MVSHSVSPTISLFKAKYVSVYIQRFKDCGGCLKHVCMCVCVCTWRQACWGGRLVPPPTVPSSIEGMVQLMYRSSPVGPDASIRVMQLLLPTDWAGSWRTHTHSTHTLTRETEDGIEVNQVIHYISWELPLKYLSTGDIDGCYQVSCVSVKPANAAGHGWANQVFIDVHVHQSFCCGLQNLQDRDKDCKCVCS